MQLTFNRTNFQPINKANQIWLTASQLAEALEYSDVRSVTKIYQRNADEFTSSMTEVVKLTTTNNNVNLQTSTRIFSLRGCHLIAMFARTAIAKEFRKWVLDVLDKEIGEPVQIRLTSDDTLPLRNAVNIATGVLKLDYSTIYKMVHQRFGINEIKDLSKDEVG